MDKEIIDHHMAVHIAKNSNRSVSEVKRMMVALRTGSEFKADSYAPCMQCNVVTNKFFIFKTEGEILTLCKRCNEKTLA